MELDLGGTGTNPMTTYISVYDRLHSGYSCLNLPVRLSTNHVIITVHDVRSNPEKCSLPTGSKNSTNERLYPSLIIFLVTK